MIAVRFSRMAALMMRIAAAMLFASALAGCFLPHEFDAEIVIDRKGAYGIAFEGELNSVPLQYALVQGELNDRDERERRIRDTLADLENSGLSDVRHLGRARFSARYDREGHLGLERTVYFVRRNAKILTVEYNYEVEEITVRGATLRTDQKKLLGELGLTMKGQLRVRTDAKVIQQNADRVVQEGLSQTYIWFIENIYGPAPKLVIKVTR
jgi:hypothetical protein